MNAFTAAISGMGICLCNIKKEKRLFPLGLDGSEHFSTLNLMMRYNPGKISQSKQSKQMVLRSYSRQFVALIRLLKSIIIAMAVSYTVLRNFLKEE